MNTEKFLERLDELYLPPQHEFTQVDVPEFRYAVIDGKGSPENQDFSAAKNWLYAVVHMVKPLVKKRMGESYVEPPLEYLFWAQDAQDFPSGNKQKWSWRGMVVLIDWITDEHFQKAVAKVEEKLGTPPKTFRLETLHEGRCVQIMHVGNYDQVSSICDELYSVFLSAHNLKPNGCYHEIYLNDPNRTRPNKRRIVIRQPVA